MDYLDVDIESIRQWQKHPLTVFYKNELEGVLKMHLVKLSDFSLETICTEGFSRRVAHTKGIIDSLALCIKNLEDIQSLLDFYKPMEDDDETSDSSRA